MSGGACSPTAKVGAVVEHEGASRGDPVHVQPGELDVHEENLRVGSKFESVTAGVVVLPLLEAVAFTAP